MMLVVRIPNNQVFFEFNRECILQIRGDNIN